MNEIDILKNIAENFSQRKSSAALNNYEVLGNNIKFLNDTFSWGIDNLSVLHKQIELDFEKDELVNNNFKDNSKSHFYFRKILPRIVSNDISIIHKLIANTQPDDRQNITLENVHELKKTFLDFSNLVTASRQFIDSLVSDAYQLIKLESKEINFHVLTSLHSFNRFVTKSIRQALFNSEIENSLNEFNNLSNNKRIRGNESHITKCSEKSFGNKVDFLFTQLNLSTETDFQNKLKDLFSFSSEFTHIGYVSTFFTSSSGSEVIFKDDISPYLPSTENFSELKYELLEIAMRFFTKVYLPSVDIALKTAFKTDAYDNLSESLNVISDKISKDLKTRNNQYYFFIKQGLIESEETIDLTCICGTTRNWKAPHDMSKIFCSNCGSQFNLLEIEGDPGYIITSNGPVKVIGSSVPDFNDLPIEEQIDLLKQCENVVKEQTE